MDDVRPAAPAARRTGSLLVLALVASTALSALTPATAASTAPLVDVVVTSTGAGVAAAADAVRAAGGTVRDALPLVGGVSAELPEGAMLAPAFRVVQDYPITLSGRKGAGQDREPTAVREALGLGAAAHQGAGITVAVVDTGVADHPDLEGRLEHVDVTGTYDEVYRDPYGHGTFVAGVIAGDGSSSEDSRFAGVAPGARILDVRVADEAGETSLSFVLAGLEVAAEAGVDVVNLSLSSGSPLPYQLDPLAVALTSLWRDGVVVVVPTGNDGPSQGSVTSPGSDPTLLTVGALDEQLTNDRSDDVVPAFSGRGPAPQDVAKPDLVAPGRSLVSLRAESSLVDTANADAVVDDDYFRGSGTSFATAAVAGTAAVLLEKRALLPDQVKALVTGTAYTAKGLRDGRDAGAGGLDVVAALAAGTPKVTPVADDAPPTGDVDAEAWHAFLQALMDGDRAAAAKAWNSLTPADHKWAANSWSAHKWGAHKWGANSWSAHKWAGEDGSAEEWEARFWAAHKWAAHKWASDTFVAHKWAAHKWAAHKWAAHEWSAHKWSAYVWS